MVRGNPGLYLSQLRFRDPDDFVAGNIHNHADFWRSILLGYHKELEIMDIIENGVNIQNFFQFFNGNFHGKMFRSSTPSHSEFNNSPSCAKFHSFVTSTILDWVSSGALQFWGKVGEVEPPHLVLPLTVEPTKPRLCHDERFLNLWIKDLPLKLDLVTDLPRYVFHGHYQTVFDDKNGYQHVRLNANSRTYFGVRCYFVYFSFCHLGGRRVPIYTIRWVW